jgi:TrmH family RNA methyltransferase
VVEGPQSVRSALAAGVVVHDLFVDDEAGDAFPDLVAEAESLGIPVTRATAGVLAAMGETEHPQGVLAVCALLPSADLDAMLARRAPVLILEGLADPGNVGTIIRTADAAGAAGVILTAGSVDPHNGKVVRSTAGSLFHVPVAYDATLVDVVDAVRRHDRPLAVASGGGDEDLFEVVAARMACRGSCWLIGSEAHGASPEALEEADIVVRIPMWGGAESLNAAAAAAILLYVPRYEGTVHGRTAPGSMTADAAAMPTG